MYHKKRFYFFGKMLWGTLAGANFFMLFCLMEALGMNNDLYDCIVIGGGISGISFAHKLQGLSQKVLLLEKNERLGGQIHTLVCGDDPQFYLELGAHTCYNSYVRLLSIITDLQIDQYLCPLEKYPYKIYSDGKIGSPMGKVSLPSLLIHGPQIFFKSRKGKTVKEYFSPIVGAKNYDGLFSNMFRAVICQEADDYPAELFLKGRKERLKQFPRKYTFDQGLSSLLEHVVTDSGFNHVKGEEVVEVRYIDHVYSVVTRNGGNFQGKRIAFATSPHVVSHLLQEIEPEMSGLLQTIPMVTSGTISIIVQKERILVDPVAGIIPIDDSFFSAVSADGIAHPHLRGFSFHYRQHHQDTENMIGLACKVLEVNKDDILETAFTTHTLPSLRLPHRNMARQIEDVRRHDSIFVLGNYFYGLSIEDCVHRSFDEYDRYSRAYL